MHKAIKVFFLWNQMSHNTTQPQLHA